MLHGEAMLHSEAVVRSNPVIRSGAVMTGKANVQRVTVTPRRANAHNKRGYFTLGKFERVADRVGPAGYGRV